MQLVPWWCPRGNTAWHCQAARRWSRRHCRSLASGTAAAGVAYSTKGPRQPPSAARGIPRRWPQLSCGDVGSGLHWLTTRCRPHLGWDHEDAPPRCSEPQRHSRWGASCWVWWKVLSDQGPEAKNNLGSRNIANREQAKKKLFLFLDLTYYISIMPSRCHHVVSNG